jgi:ABC-type transport system involved in multi-copper enzyme maturation permease subunit
MKLWEIFRFELAYQVRRIWPWLIFAALLVFAYLFTREGSLADALYGDFFLNSPFVIVGATVTGSLIWLLVAGVIAGEAGARDVATGMHPLTYTTPVSKSAYLGGRFLAAFVLNALILLAVPLANLLAVTVPGVHPDVVGPFRPAAYLTAYAFIALPNAFLATAIQFSLAAWSGRPMASYLGSMLVFSMSYVVGLFLVLQGRPDLANLLDPIGVHFILSELARLWTPVEKATRLLALEGIVLRNRLLWSGVGLAALAVSYLSFRFAHRAESIWWRRITRPLEWLRGRRYVQDPFPAGTGVAAGRPISVPQVRREHGFAVQVRQTLAVAWDSFRSIATSWAGLGLLVVVPLLTVVVVLDQMVLGNVPLVPATIFVINELTAPLTAELSRWVIVPLLIVFFAGELVWREREAGLGEIADAMPVTEWIPFLGKFLGLGLLLLVFMTLQMMAGVLAQVIIGYTDFEIGLYLQILFGLQLPEYLLFAVLAIVVHVLVDQKYVGHVAAILVYVVIILASMFGLEHNLLIYGGGPDWFYTELRGFGPSLAPWLWFKLYWVAWALLLIVVGRLLWVRGRETAFAMRLRLARRRFTGLTVWTAAAVLGLILVLGGFIFYNTNVLNEYVSTAEVTERRAEYERRYAQYAGIAQPQMESTNLHVEIYPQRRELEIRGSYSLLNNSDVAIDSIHVSTVPGVEPEAMALDRAAALVVADEEHGYRIYELEQPLQPGDSLRLEFEIEHQPRGFRNNGVDPSVAANGTRITSGDWLPAIGYQTERELIVPGERREQGLAERPLLPTLDEIEPRPERAEQTAFEAVVGTDMDQIAVAPGALRRTWTEGGRRYFHYVTSAPIGNEYGIYSADYSVREATWEPATSSGQSVAIQIFHHPEHTVNLERMVRSVQASLDHFTEQFGPYPYNHIWILEAPGTGTGMHADASHLIFSEGFALLNPDDADPQALDLPFAVMAHEMAHQFQVPYAFAEGAPLLSESFAWYAAMQVVEQAQGPERLQQLRSFMREPYPIPPIRSGVPLLRAMDPYAAYRAGPFALHALSEYIGEERVNLAFRRLREEHGSGEPPLPTTLDLYRELQAVTPDSFQYLLHDLFQVNTFWELQVEQVTAEQNETGAWQVTLEVLARKVVVDEAGVETEVPMDELIEIGVFADPEEGGELSEPLYLEMHRVSSGRQTITVTVPREPDLAGIDPYHLLDWEEKEDDDNIDAVES